MRSWTDVLIMLVFLVIVGLGGFLGWHMTPLALAVATGGVLLFWIKFHLVEMKGIVGSDVWAISAVISLVLLAGMWIGTTARPLSGFLNGKTLRLATDMFIR